MRAILDRIIVKRELAESQIGRFVIPLQDQPDEGTVVAVGPGKTAKKGMLIPMPVKVGEKVYFDRLSGQELDEGGERFVVLTPEVLIGVASV